MSAPADIIAGLRAALLADEMTAAACGGRVFGGAVPAGEARSMPRSALLVRPSGGASLTAGSDIEHDTQRVDLFAYGANGEHAASLIAIARAALTRLRREVHAGVLIHWVQSGGGFTVGLEPGVDWPRAMQSFQVFHTLDEVAEPTN